MNQKKIFVCNFFILFLFASFIFAQSPTETLSVSGLKENVIVRRDGRSIPYIEAKTETDLYFAQGYATASDRLWQMDLLRRVASGRTAEIFGNVTLEDDKRWRRFGFTGVTNESYKSFSPEYRAVLDSYARGVNAYIATLNEKTLPVEFQILKYAPEAWKPTDSLLIGKILADGLSTSWYEDATRAKFQFLSKEMFDELFIKKTPFDVLVVGKDTDEKVKTATNKSSILAGDLFTSEFLKAEERYRKNSLERIGFYQEFNAASNNWVVSGKKTLDGRPLLANDPHLPSSVPSIWYLVNLSTPNGKVAGVTFPGVPGVVLGHNEFIAWGATNLGPDVQDLYVEKFNDKNQYQSPKGWRVADVRTEQIKVRKNPLSPETETVELQVIETDNGVVIQDMGEKKIALKWTALFPENNEFEAFYLLNRAKNWNDFKSALKTYGGATQNFIYADVKGNIGFHNGGRIPIRRAGDGSVPYDGTKNDGDWTGYIPFEDLPHSYNPPEGFIVTANQRLAGDSYKYFLGHSWADPYRARRIYQLLQANSKLTPNDFADIQKDVYSISYANFAREIVNSESASAETLSALKGWDGRITPDSKAALLIYEIRREFKKAVLEGILGAEKAKDYRWSMSESFVDWLAREKPKNWLPKNYANFNEILKEADTKARNNLSTKFGVDESKWTYGENLKFNFRHPLAGVPLLGSIFAIPSIPAYGGYSTPNVGSAVSMRLIATPGNWDQTRHVITLGESGDPKSPFYKDQLEFWKKGISPVFPFSDAAIEKETKVMILMKP